MTQSGNFLIHPRIQRKDEVLIRRFIFAQNALEFRSVSQYTAAVLFLLPRMDALPSDDMVS